MEFPVGIAAHSVQLSFIHIRIFDLKLIKYQVPDMAGLVHGETYRSCAGFDLLIISYLMRYLIIIAGT